MPGGNSDEQQQRADDWRRPDDLEGLALRFHTIDHVEQRARADEIDSVDVRHVDGNDGSPLRERHDSSELAVLRAGDDAGMREVLRVVYAIRIVGRIYALSRTMLC